MKKKLFALLAFVMSVMTASAVGGYDLSVGSSEQGTIAFTVNGEPAEYADEGDEVTVTITPNEGWSVGTVTGQWYAAVAKAPRRALGIDLLSDVELTPVQDAENQWTFTMQRANVIVSASYRKLLTNEDITIDDIEDLTYNGQAQTPVVNVQDGSSVLVKGTDFAVSCSNNVNAGTATATITGIGDYDGEVVMTFTINKANASVSFGIPYTYEMTYGDPQFTILPQVVGDGKLKYWSGNKKVATVDEETGEVTIVGAGETRIWAKISDGDNYIGSSDWYQLIIAPKGMDDLTIADIDDLTYTGKALKPGMVMKDGTVTLIEGTDYTLAYTNNVNVGIATVTVTGIGNYSGTRTAEFTITQAAGSISYAKADITKTIGGTAFTNELTIVGDGTVSYSSSNPNVATVDAETGELTLLGVGQTIITATVADGANYQYAEKTARYTLTVVADKSALDASILSAEEYYESIKNDYADIAAPLLQAINDAKVVQADDDVTMTAVAHAVEVLDQAVQDAKDAVEAIITGIVTPKTAATIGQWYDLNGRRVAQPTKGVYIQNGRKVLVK